VFNVESLSTDVVVVGSGAAGLRAAISARQQGLDTCVISKLRPGKGTCTTLSGGVFAGTPYGEPPSEHISKTLQAGRGINQQELVEALAADAPTRLKELSAWGIKAEFRRGYLYYLGRAPVWGSEIIRCLLTKAEGLGIRFLGGMVVWDLGAHGGQTTLVAYRAASGEWVSVGANAVVLATGGAASLYRRSDNPRGLGGDGYILALRAGAVLQDMEFVQFYPLGLAEPGCPSMVIPPDLADKGSLRNSEGQDIYAKYAVRERPAGAKARDRLSRALLQEIQLEGHEVWLDLRGVSREEWCSDPFSASTWEILGERYQARYRAVRVAPMAHHVMGGVCINPHGETSIPGVFAAGEVAGGLHGANRMGGNALTEAIVFGARAGEAAVRWVKEGNASDISRERPMPAVYEPSGARAGALDPQEIRDRLQWIMWTRGGAVRSKGGLQEGLEELREIQTDCRKIGRRDDPRSIQRAVELDFCVTTGTLILQAALRREESRGAHFRADFPNQDDGRWRGHLQVRAMPEGGELWNFNGAGSWDDKRAPRK